jgi:ketosteroid isomerase-like protein
MKKIKCALFILVVSTFAILPVAAQSKEEIIKTVDGINRALDRAVVSQDIPFLKRHYGDDFVFTHGTGQVDSKESWVNAIKTMKAPERYALREHDSTQVELHGDIAILSGKLSVTRESKTGTRNYALWYVRVYALRNNVWQMISHRTTKEWHL